MQDYDLLDDNECIALEVLNSVGTSTETELDNIPIAAKELLQEEAKDFYLHQASLRVKLACPTIK